MKMELYESKVESRESSVRTPGSRIFRPRPSALDPRPLCAFTIVELLVVISILGIMAALTVPVLKNFAKSDATLGASRQLLDGVARARQLAISQRTTVYMVFVPGSFWGSDPSGFLSSLTLAQRTAANGRAAEGQPGAGPFDGAGLLDQITGVLARVVSAGERRGVTGFFGQRGQPALQPPGERVEPEDAAV